MANKPIQTRGGTVMLKTAFIILLVIFIVGSALGQNWEMGSFEDAQAKAKVSGKLLLLDFFQEYG